jgi:TRAP-type C4-dicarboxylate transport system substrate-binding protein
MKLSSLLLAILLGSTAALAACKKEQPTAIDKAVDGVQDALDMRENEAAKDAVEDLQSAGENAAEAIEDKAEEVREEMAEE